MSELFQTLGDDPFAALEAWIDEAARSGAPEPTAATLATASREGLPSARMMLCKGVTPTGVRFFTNYQSRKAGELAQNPNAAVVFFWPTLARQVRLEGRVVRSSRQVSEEYFATRPRGSQIGAWASPQSRVLADFTALDALLAAAEQAFDDKPVPCPPHWGGYELTAHMVEFWLGHPSRLHDRVRFERGERGERGWRKQQLAP